MCGLVVVVNLLSAPVGYGQLKRMVDIHFANINLKINNLYN